MPKTITRREFVHASTAAAGLALGAAPAFGQAPAVRTGSTPLVIASDNGNVFKNGGMSGLTDANNLLALPAGDPGILTQTTRDFPISKVDFWRTYISKTETLVSKECFIELV